jgi:ATP-dependent RNA helicase HelY
MAMLIMRTADNLRQIASLRETHPETSALAAKAREAILREPVVFESPR